VASWFARERDRGSRSPAEFVATVRDVAPSIEVDAVEPGRRLAL